ncbi:DUF6003 family protein [Streptomyces albipurpureus]|uniref:DUF6003 family protein n=1 Tax=Streptomyces albipurpureus TaxID=2897419 RepID=A0ABT0UX69_9ACTN|nr:DUF6003 family protein [Streptomyces sp. CWNU-1]MCM2391943.1 DUF6003 family protein [Streptomyces sp. CWNU-1]
MADEAQLFLLSERSPRLGAALGAVGALECVDTPAVRGWLDAHRIPASSPRVRIVPAGSEVLIPDDADRLPVPLSEEEIERVHSECAPQSITEVESELLAFRDTAEDWEALVLRALTAGVPAPRIVELTGLEPQDIARLARR